MRSRFWALGLALAVGCVHDTALVPSGTGPDPAAGAPDPFVATVEEAGVRLTVRGDAWEGEPYDLDEFVRPVKVELENGSQVPLSIRYERFQLRTSAGFRYTALPPFEVTQGGDRPTVVYSGLQPVFPHRGFRWYAWYGDWYADIPMWTAPVTLDSAYYSTLYGQWGEALPTKDMLEKALPEGVLEPGGRVEGFLYFRDVGSVGAEMTLMAELVGEGEGGQAVGTLRVPMTVVETP